MKENRLLIITVIAAVVFMPAMLFVFSRNQALAGNMVLEDAVMIPDDTDAVDTTLNVESNIKVVEGVSPDVDVSIGIPLNYDVETDNITVHEDKAGSLIRIAIPSDDKDFYYRNQLTGSQKGIASMTYGYADGIADFDIKTDGYYIPTVHLTPKELSLELTRPEELYGQVFLIDASHGGEDTGNCAYGVMEKDVNLRIAKAIAARAEASDEGGFYLTRGSDEKIAEEDRQKLTELLNPEIYIALHVNADKDTRVTNGISAVVGNPDDEKKVGKLISVIAEETGQKDLGVKTDPAVTYGGEHCVIIYTGYVTNKAEALMIQDPEYASKIGGIIYAWLMHEEKEGI